MIVGHDLVVSRPSRSKQRTGRRAAGRSSGRHRASGSQAGPGTYPRPRNGHEQVVHQRVDRLRAAGRGTGPSTTRRQGPGRGCGATPAVAETVLGPGRSGLGHHVGVGAGGSPPRRPATLTGPGRPRTRGRRRRRCRAPGAAPAEGPRHIGPSRGLLRPADERLLEHGVAPAGCAQRGNESRPVGDEGVLSCGRGPRVETPWTRSTTRRRCGRRRGRRTAMRSPLRSRRPPRGSSASRRVSSASVELVEVPATGPGSTVFEVVEAPRSSAWAWRSRSRRS